MLLRGAELTLFGEFAEYESVISCAMFCELLAILCITCRNLYSAIEFLKDSKSVKACNIHFALSSSVL